jgi:hypothetical protein
MGKIYVLKIGHLVFDVVISQNIVSGRPDVNYTVGSILIIREYDDKTMRSTGRNLLSKITSVDPVLLRFELINPTEFFNLGVNNGQ